MIIDGIINKTSDALSSLRTLASLPIRPVKYYFESLLGHHDLEGYENAMVVNAVIGPILLMCYPYVETHIDELVVLHQDRLPEPNGLGWCLCLSLCIGTLLVGSAWVSLFSCAHARYQQNPPSLGLEGERPQLFLGWPRLHPN
jgi:hypothetical protein